MHPATPRPQLTVLTGASRGLGHALATQLLQSGHTLLCMARHPDAALAALARTQGATLEQWPLDLAHSEAAAARLRDWLATQAHTDWHSVTLINNAGVMPTAAALGDIAPAELAQALRVTLEAPLLLCAAFLAATADWGAQRRILNISSGLGRHPLAAQAAYCAAKAGMDHFTRCLALEEAARPNGARVCALAPGVVDTDMQRQLREADPAHFAQAARYRALHEQGQLTSAAEAARQVLAYLARPDFGQQAVADVRQD